MRCEEAVVDIGSSLTGELEPEAEARLREHLAGCAACRAEHDRLSDLWVQLGELPGDVPDEAAMQRRFLAALDTFQSGADQARVQVLQAQRRPVWQAALAWSGAIAASLLVGAIVGRGMAPRPAAATDDIAALRQELHDTREMVTLSLLQQTSASERLRGVSWTEQIDDPGADVVAALLDALAHDPNVNVRLASVDALARFADKPGVRRGAIAALSDRRAPLVQIALIDLLVQLKEPASRDTLRQLVSDEMTDVSVRSRAEWGLQQIG
jgi:hypothetical protein